MRVEEASPQSFWGARQRLRCRTTGLVHHKCQKSPKIDVHVSKETNDKRTMIEVQNESRTGVFFVLVFFKV